MFLQPKELGDTAMGLDYSERHPCSLTVWQRWNEAAGLSIFICYLWGSGRFGLKHIQTIFPCNAFHGSSLWLLRSVTIKLVIAFFQENHQQRSKSLPGSTFDVCIFQTRRHLSVALGYHGDVFLTPFAWHRKGNSGVREARAIGKESMVLWLPACLSNNYKGLVLWYVY